MQVSGHGTGGRLIFGLGWGGGKGAVVMEAQALICR